MQKLFKFFIISILLVGLLTGCNINRDVEKLSKDLYKEKTEYIKDQSEIESIISKLQSPQGYGYDSSIVSEDTYAHSIVLYFTPDKDVEYDKDIFNIHSAVIFSLVENLDEIVYSAQSEGIEGIDPIDRKPIDEFTKAAMGKTTQELGANKKNFKELIKYYEEKREKDKSG